MTRTGKYSAVQAAKVLGISKPTMLRWYRKGLFRPGECTIATVGRRMLLFSGKALLRVWDSNGHIK